MNDSQTATHIEEGTSLRDCPRLSKANQPHQPFLTVVWYKSSKCSIIYINTRTNTPTYTITKRRSKYLMTYLFQRVSPELWALDAVSTIRKYTETIIWPGNGGYTPTWTANILSLINVIIEKNRNFYDKGDEDRLRQINDDYKSTCAFLKENQEIILTRADKGNITVASLRSTFTRMRQEHIDSMVAANKYGIPTERYCIIKNRMEHRWRRIVIMLARHILDNRGGNGNKGTSTRYCPSV